LLGGGEFTFVRNGTPVGNFLANTTDFRTGPGWGSAWRTRTPPRSVPTGWPMYVVVSTGTVRRSLSLTLAQP